MKAIFPGSFDPIHNGHINIIKKANILFSKLYIVITNNFKKKNQTNIKIRAKQAIITCNNFNLNVKVIINNKMLTSDFAKKLGIKYIIRGLRNNNDLNYEMKLAFANKQLNKHIETIFFISDYGLNKISSTFLKQIKKIKKNI